MTGRAIGPRARAALCVDACDGLDNPLQDVELAFEAIQAAARYLEAREVLGGAGPVLAGVVELLHRAELALDPDAVHCYDCERRAHPDDCRPILLDDNGPGEPPSLEGHVCPECAEDRDIEAFKGG